MIQRNNPGNIRCNPANDWQGQIGCGGGFVVFSSLFYGVRAMFKILLNDIASGKDTISQLIYEYAPPHENDTEGYIANVVSWSGIGRNQSLSGWPAGIMAVCAAMIRMETGTSIDPGDLSAPYMAAAGSVPVPDDDGGGFPILPAAILAYLLT